MYVYIMIYDLHIEVGNVSFQIFVRVIEAVRLISFFPISFQ